eukprot:GHVN01105993.1.p1 GENE.GHVN01105993.1~~GHVN01105993.1.p1  ORF type:complete len:502 (+),score=128.74 GHVN01105993.1:1627-3132(+)
MSGGGLCFLLLVALVCVGGCVATHQPSGSGVPVLSGIPARNLIDFQKRIARMKEYVELSRTFNSLRGGADDPRHRSDTSSRRTLRTKEGSAGGRKRSEGAEDADANEMGDDTSGGKKVGRDGSSKGSNVVALSELTGRDEEADDADFDEMDDEISDTQLTAAMNFISHLMKRTPPVTKAYLTTSLALALYASLTNYSVWPKRLALDWRHVGRGELWRLLTPFFYVGPMGISYFLTLHFIWTYLSSIEKHLCHNPAEFFALLSFAVTGLLGSSAFTSLKGHTSLLNGFKKARRVTPETPITSTPSSPHPPPSAGSPRSSPPPIISPRNIVPKHNELLGHHLASFLVYVWSRLNEGSEVNYLDLFNVKAEHLPWLFLFQSWMTDGDVAVLDVGGIALGWLYMALKSKSATVGGSELREVVKLIQQRNLMNTTGHEMEEGKGNSTTSSGQSRGVTPGAVSGGVWAPLLPRRVSEWINSRPIVVRMYERYRKESLEEQEGEQPDA